MPGPLVCHNCQKLFSRSSGAGLFCSKACAAQFNERLAAAQDALLGAGFEKNGLMYRKDGIHVTPQRVMHVGLEKVLEEHAKIAEAKAATAERITRSAENAPS